MSDPIFLSEYKTLQEAIDALPEYGTLIVPPGRWCAGSARFKSNMTLHLAPGAVLAAPESMEQHIDSTGVIFRSPLWKYCFLALFNVENVTIEGAGVLDGRGHLFWPGYDGEADTVERDPATGFFKGQIYDPTTLHPSLIILFKCRNITIRDIRIVDSGAFTVWALGCDILRIDSIHIKNIRRGPNTDGLDISSCSDVWITNCLLETGDDSIALKSDNAAIGMDKPCERIHISGNTLSSLCCGIRLGYEGDGAIRDVIIRDNIIRDTNVGVDMLAILPTRPRQAYTGIYKGAKIENILIRGMIMRNVRLAFKLWNWTEDETMLPELEGFIRNVTLADMQIEAVDASFIGGKSISGIRLENIRMDVKRFKDVYKDAVPLAMPNIWGRGYMKEPLTIFNTEDIQMENVIVTEGIQQ